MSRNVPKVSLNFKVCQIQNTAQIVLKLSIFSTMSFLSIISVCGMNLTSLDVRHPHFGRCN